MTQTTAVSVASQVRKLAKEHMVTADPDGMSRMAVLITRMAGMWWSWMASNNCSSISRKKAF